MSTHTAGTPAAVSRLSRSPGLAARLLRALRRAFELAGKPYADGRAAPM